MTFEHRHRGAVRTQQTAETTFVIACSGRTIVNEKGGNMANYQFKKNALKSLIADAGYSMADMARTLDIDENAFRAMLRNPTSIKMPVAKGIAQHTGKTVQQVLDAAYLEVSE